MLNLARNADVHSELGSSCVRTFFDNSLVRNGSKFEGRVGGVQITSDLLHLGAGENLVVEVSNAPTGFSLVYPARFVCRDCQSSESCGRALSS